MSLSFRSADGYTAALEHISLEVTAGAMLAVVGESGSGKSVTALSILHLLPPAAARVDQGEILFSPDGVNAIDLRKLSEKELRSLRGNRIGIIFQEPMTSLNPVMTCGRQVMEPLQLHRKLNNGRARREVLELFKKVRLPDPEVLFNRYPHQLSGGQKQRVMIAMAISCKPALLICDEPTTALDVTVQKTILELLQDLRKSENMGMIFITHDLGLVSDMADRAVVMYRGRIVEKGSVEDLFLRPQHPYTRGLLFCRPVLHQKGERLPVVSDFLDGQQPAGKALPDLMGLNAETKNTGGKKAASGILISVKGLNIWYSSGKTWLGRQKGWTKAVQDVSFDVFNGETLGLVGESGCGKTTLGRALLRLNKPVSGSIRFDDRDLLAMPDSELRPFRKNIQIVFQDPYSSLNPRLTIGSALSEPLKIHASSLNASERKEKVKELLRKVDLKPEHVNRYPHEFSGGQRQRIVIARALALNPDFVVFDESVSALDVSIQAQVLNLINDLKREFGFTAVFISHDLSVVHYLCDRVMVMEKGRIVEMGDAETLYRNPQTAYTKSLIDAIPGRKWIDR
ncbi:MAG: ABC transporter ATP-binding protein [Bacteroidota bacterium]|nr:ABC transporter ATP-binding protein [Bacteroidota bacterium]MDP4248652.1 ABC transporter ATP-binding protein [Bacteroidota bacterium]